MSGNRIKIGVGKNLLNEASKQYPNVSVTQAIEYLILEGIKSINSANERSGKKDEERQTAEYQG
jgi:hypothetical protein